MFRIDEAHIISLDSEDSPRFQRVYGEVNSSIGPNVSIQRAPGVYVPQNTTTPGDYGCMLAHYNAIKNISDSEDTGAWKCVFEDDVANLSPVNVTEMLSEYPPPDNANFIQLGICGNHKYLSGNSRRFARDSTVPRGALEGVKWEPGLDICAHAYCMSTPGAKSMVQHLDEQQETHTNPIDVSWNGLKGTYRAMASFSEAEETNLPLFDTTSQIYAQYRDDDEWASRRREINTTSQDNLFNAQLMSLIRSSRMACSRMASSNSSWGPLRGGMGLCFGGVGVFFGFFGIIFWGNTGTGILEIGILITLFNIFKQCSQK